MNKIILCLVSVLTIQSSFAQKFDLDYYKTYPELGSYGLGKSIMLTGEDSIVIAGEAANNHIFMMKTNRSGDRLWNTFERADFSPDYQSINDMILDKDGNYVIVGWHGASSYTYFNKVSPQGTFLATTIDGGQFGYGPGFGVAQTLDGGFFIASVYRDYNLGDLMALRKVNNQGVFEWSKNFLGGQPRALKKKSNTEYYMTGYRDYEKGSAIDGDVFLMKLNINGDSVWTKIYKKDGTSEFGNDLIILPNNEGFLICGTEPDSIIGNYTQGFLLKTDIAGNLEWKKSYYRGQWGTSFLKMKMDSRGDIVVMAITNGGSSDLTLLKYNLNGDRLQVEHFDFNMNENYGDLVINKKGEIFVTGSAPNGSLLKIIDHCPLDSIRAYLLDPEPSLGNDVFVAIDSSMNGFEYKLIKTNTNEVLDSANGTGTALYLNGGPATASSDEFGQGYCVKLVHPLYNCTVYSDTLYIYLTSNETKTLSTINYFLYPNPANNSFTIRYRLFEKDRITMNLVDINGREVQQLMVNERRNQGANQESFSLSVNLVPGIYFIQIISSHTHNTLRLVVQ